VAEEQPPVFQVGSKPVSPLRENVYKQPPTRLHDAHALVNPRKAPLQVLTRFQVIFNLSVAIDLSKVEGWVGENAINGFIFEGGKQIEAIGLVKGSSARQESRQ
jgi:hypothetical protein